MTKKSLVVQHNKIIEAKYRLSVGEQRLIKYLVSLIEPEDADFKPYRIAVTDLMKLLELSDKDFYRKIKAWSKQLTGNVLTFHGEGGEELQVAWLSSAEYQPKSGIVELEFSPKLKPFLLHLKGYFTAYELGNVIRLKHTYSIRIYELLKQYQKLGRRKFNLDELRELLMLEEGEYSQFFNFRNRILKTAREELAEKTDLIFTWNEEKIRQKCVAIEFIIQSQPFPQERETSEGSPVFPEPGGAEEPAADIPKSSPAPLRGVEELMALGVTRATALDLVEQYGAERVLDKVAYTRTLQQEGKVKNPAGFMVEAIRNEYRDNQAEERERQAKARQAREAKAAREREAQAVTNQARLHRKQAIQNFLEALTPAQRETLEAEFIESYQDNPVLIQRYRKQGMESAMVRGCFSDFVFKEKLSA